MTELNVSQPIIEEVNERPAGEHRISETATLHPERTTSEILRSCASLLEESCAQDFNVSQEIGKAYGASAQAVSSNSPYYKIVEAIEQIPGVRSIAPMVKKLVLSSYLETTQEEIEHLRHEMQGIERSYRDSVRQINGLKKQGRRVALDYRKLEETEKELTGRKTELEEAVAGYHRQLKENPFDTITDDKVESSEREIEEIETNVGVIRDRRERFGQELITSKIDLEYCLQSYVPQEQYYTSLERGIKEAEQVAKDFKRSLVADKGVKGYVKLMERATALKTRVDRMHDALKPIRDLEDKAFSYLDKPSSRSQTLTQDSLQKHHRRLQEQQQRKTVQVQDAINAFL